MSKPVLHIVDILRWGDAHYDRTGKWPETKSGELFDAPDEKWANRDSGRGRPHQMPHNPMIDDRRFFLIRVRFSDRMVDSLACGHQHCGTAASKTFVFRLTKRQPA